MKKSQNERILKYLQGGHLLTPLAALHRFGCLRLGARVWDLKKEGYKIDSRLVNRSNKYVSEYSIAST